MDARTIGTSRQGRAIFAHERGRGGLLIFGAIHGDEVESARLCEALLQFVPTQDAPLCVVPVANPDGFAARDKNNAAGVDLNRNFAARSWTREHRIGYDPGPSPLSEPESAALATLVEARRPSLIIAVHQPYACVNWDGPADEVAAVMSQRSGLPLQPSIGYPTPGSFGSWAGIDRSIAVITFELAKQVDDTALARALDAVLAAWSMA